MPRSKAKGGKSKIAVYSPTRRLLKYIYRYVYFSRTHEYGKEYVMYNGKKQHLSYESNKNRKGYFICPGGLR